jgi:hypothetical protein
VPNDMADMGLQLEPVGRHTRNHSNLCAVTVATASHTASISPTSPTSAIGAADATSTAQPSSATSVAARSAGTATDSLLREPTLQRRL